MEFKKGARISLYMRKTVLNMECKKSIICAGMLICIYVNVVRSEQTVFRVFDMGLLTVVFIDLELFSFKGGH